jgi:hypothetical protein
MSGCFGQGLISSSYAHYCVQHRFCQLGHSSCAFRIHNASGSPTLLNPHKHIDPVTLSSFIGADAHVGATKSIIAAYSSNARTLGHLHQQTRLCSIISRKYKTTRQPEKIEMHALLPRIPLYTIAIFGATSATPIPSPWKRQRAPLPQRCLTQR